MAGSPSSPLFTEWRTGTVRALLDMGFVPNATADFNIIGDGVTDNTANMNIAHSQTKGYPIFYPPGTYKFSKLNTITAGGIIGLGKEITKLQSTDTSGADVIPFSADQGIFTLRDFSLYGNAPASIFPLKSTGAGISISAPNNESVYSVIDNVKVNSFPVNFHVIRASLYKFNICDFVNYTISGLQVENQNNADSGDGVIQGSLFFSLTSLGDGLTYNSGGGLKIQGSKFLGGVNGINLLFNGGANTGDLFITNCSIENGSNAGISLSRTAGAHTFANITITGCGLLGAPHGIITDNSGAFSRVSVSGNIIVLTGGTNKFAVLLDTVNDFIVGDNVLVGQGGTTFGVYITAPSTNGKIGKNNYQTFGTPLTNLSSSTFVDGDIQSGVINVNTASAYGALFSGSGNVAFPTPYSVVPVVTGVVTDSVGGGVSLVVKGVTAGGFSYSVIGVNNGSAVPASWLAQGVL